MLTIIASIERPTLLAAMIPRPIDRPAPTAAHNGLNAQAALPRSADTLTEKK
jgi:hypothetical protein